MSGVGNTHHPALPAATSGGAESSSSPDTSGFPHVRDWKEVHVIRAAHLLDSENMSLHAWACSKLRQMLSLPHTKHISFIAEYQNGHILRRFSELLSSTDKALVFNAVWALTNVCSGTDDDATAVVDCGCMPVLISMLKTSNIEYKGSPLACVAADEKSEAQEEAKSTDSFGSSRRFLREQIGWLLGNVCGSQNQEHRQLLVDLGAIEALV
jgi:hypothetical protein